MAASLVYLLLRQMLTRTTRGGSVGVRSAWGWKWKAEAVSAASSSGRTMRFRRGACGTR
ncbi:hypothetical protein ACFPIJ_00790 [Dactylosporangium cerinum]|uniref:Uncharacterized protein n=1 Tax=Dactylosporangium cerinum TaxID=1434730 RepID=A0ABV9VLA8_9ACTN